MQTKKYSLVFRSQKSNSFGPGPRTVLSAVTAEDLNDPGECETKQEVCDTEPAAP